MNLEKIKNLVILLFIGLNAALFAIGRYMDMEYVLSRAQQDNIKNFLSERQVGFYDDMISDFRPKPQLDLDTAAWMMPERILDWLFGEGAEIHKQEEFHKTIYESGEGVAVKTLSLLNGQEYVFDDPAGSGHIALDIGNAREVCEAAIKRLGIQELNYEFDTDSSANDGSGEMILEYRLKHDGYWVHCSYIIFTLTERGIVAMRFALFEPLSYADAPKAIYAADEALLALYYELELIYGDENERKAANNSLEIDKMDMVYNLDSGGEEGDRLTRAIPCYRIYIEGRIEPFLINAFFNTVMESGAY